MNKYEFSIIASGLDPKAEHFEILFFNAGCEDATISFQKGHIIVDFAREAESIDGAISSAVECVKKAGAQVDRIEPDPLVSLSDIAARAGLTRAAITQYARGQRGENFPSPVARITSDTSLYDWAAVATWLFQHEKLSRDKAIEAEAVKAVNEAIKCHEPSLRDALKGRLEAYEAGLEKKKPPKVVHLFVPTGLGRLFRSLGCARPTTAPRRRWKIP
jgi:transcriptional regulator with XRE-family HTH domain